MIKIICDKCGADCECMGYDVLVRVIHNPVPLRVTDTGSPTLTCDDDKMRMILCQKCFHSMGMPNIYKVTQTGKLEFEEVR